MSSTVDARFESLGLLGHEGASSDRVRSWLLSQLPEGTEGTISDLQRDEPGAAPGDLDRLLREGLKRLRGVKKG